MKSKSLILTLVFAWAAFAAPGDIATTPQLEQYLQRAAGSGYSGSVLVSEKGKTLIEKGFGFADRENKKPQTAETVFSVGSITKQFTAAGIMKLESDGRLKVTDKLSRYFPDAPADKKDITLHQLLTHTSGLRDALGDDYDNINAEAFGQLALKSTLTSAPGSQYSYSNVGYSLLGIIIERVSGKGYEQYLREALFLPSGMTHTGYVLAGIKKEALATGYRNGERWGTALDRPWLGDGPGWHLRANGGILSTVGDMYKWYLSLKNNTVLPKASTDRMFTPHVAEDPEGMSHYGYGWVIENHDGKRLIWHNGGNGVYNAYMNFDLEEDVCIIVSSNSNNKISDRVAREITSILSGGYKAVDDNTISTFPGTYRLPSGSTFTVHIDENNTLTTLFNAKDVAMLMLAGGNEKKEEIDVVEERTLKLMEEARLGEYQQLADATGNSVEEVRDQEQSFWGQGEEEFGKVKTLKALATVARNKRGLILSFIQINFEKTSRYVMYVWKGDKLMDIRSMKVVDKTFDYQDMNTFFSPTNDITLVLQKGKGNQPEIAIRTRVGDEFTAVRVDD